MVESKKSTRLYANRVLTVLFAAFCVGFCAIIWAQAHQRDTTPLSLFDIVLKVLIVSVCWGAGGLGTLLMLFWTVAWVPLIELDELGMRWRIPLWRVPPLKRNAIEWRDVRSVSVHKRRYRGVTSLNLTFHMKHAATITHHVPPTVELVVSPMMLSMTTDKLISIIGKHKPVIDADREFERLIAQYHERLEHELPDSSPNHETPA